MNANQENIPRLGRKESPLGETFSCYISALTQLHLKCRERAPTRRPVGNSSIEDPAPNLQTNRTSITAAQKSCKDTAQVPTLPRATIYPFAVQPTRSAAKRQMKGIAASAVQGCPRVCPPTSCISVDLPRPFALRKLSSRSPRFAQIECTPNCLLANAK